MTSNTKACSCGNAQPESLYQPFSCQVTEVRPLTGLETLVRVVRADGRPFGHRPGQFLQVSVAGIGEAPISVSSSPTRGDYLEFGVRKTGVVTEAIHRLQRGDRLGLRGPFGTHFDTEAMRGKDLLLISGGCGLAPMRALIQYVEDRRDDYGRITALYGAKSPQDILYQDEVQAWQQSETLDFRLTVDSVPEGTCWDANVGLITTLIGPLRVKPDRTVAVIVGPPIMYRFVIKELEAKCLADEAIVVSLERYMKCGVGKCGHCTIEHLYCCLDGPVFRLDQVRSLRGAL